MLDYLQVVNETGREIIQKIESKRERTGITVELMELTIEAGHWEEVRETDKRIRAQTRHEKNHQTYITGRELDTRDSYLGIKQIKEELQPSTYHFKHHNNNKSNIATEM